MPTLKLTVEEARDIVRGDHEEAEHIETTIVDTSRWEITKKLIFKLGDKFYKVYYNVDATEYQETRLFEGESYVDVTEVHQVEKLVKVWESVT